MVKSATLFLMLFAFSADLFGYKEIIVDLSEQRAYAIEDGEIMFDGPVSSGIRGRETPEGEYRILQKKRHHKSNLWPKPNGGAKMDYMLRLSNSGIAMHLGHVPKSGPASHGCIRMKNGFAQHMYAWARVGTSVYVEGNIEDWYAMHQRRRIRSYYDEYFIVDAY